MSVEDAVRHAVDLLVDELGQNEECLERFARQARKMGVEFDG